MPIISDALSVIQNAANSAAVAVKTKFRFAPTVAKTTAVVQVPMGSNSEVAKQVKKAPVVQKSRFERFTNFARNNPATSIAMLASAIFAVVYGVDKYLQNRQLKNLENHLGSAGDLDQFPGASQILAQDYLENANGEAAERGLEWQAAKHAYRNTLENVDEPFVGAAKIAKQLNLAEQVELAKLVKTNPDLAFAYAANLPDTADAAAAKIPADFPVSTPSQVEPKVEPKQPGLIATYLAEQAAKEKAQLMGFVDQFPGASLISEERSASQSNSSVREQFIGAEKIAAEVEKIEAEADFQESLAKFMNADHNYIPRSSIQEVPVTQDAPEYLSGEALTENLFGKMKMTLANIGSY